MTRCKPPSRTPGSVWWLPALAATMGVATCGDSVATIERTAERVGPVASSNSVDCTARARELLTELAQRNEAVSCTTRTVLARTADGPSLLRDLQGRGVLTYRCRVP